MAKQLETTIAIGGQLDPSLAKVLGAVEKNLSVLTKQTVAANRSTGSMGGGISALGGALKSVGGGVVSFAKTAVACILSVGASVAATTGAAIAGATRLGAETLKMADENQSLAETYGMTAERIQELRYAGTMLDVDLENIVGTQSKLVRSMSTARTEAEKYYKQIVDVNSGHSKAVPIMGTTVSAYYKLGVKLLDNTGQFRDSNVVFAEVIDALGKVQNPTERDALALQILGKSAMELNPLIKAGGAQLAILSEEARKSGAVVDNQTNQAMDALGDSLDALKLSAMGVATKGFAKFLPQLNAIRDALGNLLTGDPKTQGKQLGIIASQIGSIFSQGATLIPSAVSMITTALPQVLTAIGTVMPQVLPLVASGFLSVITAAAGLIPTLVPVLVSSLITLFGALVGALPQVLPPLISGILQLLGAALGLIPTLLPIVASGALQLLNGIIETLAANGPTILTAALNTVTTLALGILKAAPKLIPVIMSLVKAVVDWLSANLPLLIGAGIEAVSQIAMGLIQALPQLIAMLPVIVQAIATNMTTNLPLLISAGIGVITTLISAIITNLPMLITAAVQIATGLLNALITNLPLILSFPKQLLDALIPAFGQLDWGSIGLGLLTAVVDGLRGAGNLVIDALNTLLVGPINAMLAPLNKIGINLQIPNIPKIPGYATGILSAPGGLSLVGERGPELMNVPRGSTIYNNSETMQMLGGKGGPSIVINVMVQGGSGSVKEDARQGALAAIPDIEAALDAYEYSRERLAYG